MPQLNKINAQVLYELELEGSNPCTSLDRMKFLSTHHFSSVKLSVLKNENISFEVFKNILENNVDNYVGSFADSLKQNGKFAREFAEEAILNE